jgi:hypothetical protein
MLHMAVERKNVARQHLGFVIGRDMGGDKGSLRAGNRGAVKTHGGLQGKHRV